MFEKALNTLAIPLVTSHTSSMGYRIWHKGINNNDELKCKTTYWGTLDEIMAYIMFAGAVRVDHWLIETQSWVTIWLTSNKHTSLGEV